MGNTNELPSKSIIETKVPNLMKKASGVLAVSVGLAGVPGQSQAMNTEPVQNSQGHVQRISGMPSEEYLSTKGGQLLADVNRLRNIQEEVESLANTSNSQDGLDSSDEAEVSYMIAESDQRNNSIEAAQPITTTLEKLNISKQEFESNKQNIANFALIKDPAGNIIEQVVLHRDNGLVYKSTLESVKNPDGSIVKNPDGTDKKVFSEYKALSSNKVPMNAPLAIAQQSKDGPIVVAGEKDFRSGEMAAGVSLDKGKTYQNIDFKSYGINYPGVIQEIIPFKDVSNPNIERFILEPGNLEGSQKIILTVNTSNNTLSAIKANIQSIDAKPAQIGGGSDTQLLSINNSTNTIETVSTAATLLKTGFVFTTLNAVTGQGTEENIGSGMGYVYGLAIAENSNGTDIYTASMNQFRFYKYNKETDKFTTYDYNKMFNKTVLPKFSSPGKFNALMSVDNSIIAYGAYQDTNGDANNILVSWPQDKNPELEPSVLTIVDLGLKQGGNSQKNMQLFKSEGEKGILVNANGYGNVFVKLNEDGSLNKNQPILYPDKGIGTIPEKTTYGISIPLILQNRPQ